MKTIILLITTTALVAGATSAMANDFQGSDEAASYALSHRAVSGFGGAFNSVRMPGDARNSTHEVPRAIVDFQAGGN